MADKKEAKLLNDTELQTRIRDLSKSLDELTAKIEAEGETDELRGQWDASEKELAECNAELQVRADGRKVALERNKRARELRQQSGNLLNDFNSHSPNNISNRVGDYGETATNRVIVPAQARRTNLRAFETQEDAYLSGRWLMANVLRHEASRQWVQDHSHLIETRAMSGNVNSAGGYLVPIAFGNALIKLAEEYGVARRYCRRVSMPTDTYNVPVWSSGLTGYWLTDNATVTASDETISNAALVAKKLGALTRYSTELDEDAVIDVAEELSREMARVFANEEDDALFNGDGTSTYGGIKGLKSAIAAGSKETAIAGNTAFSTLDLADFEDMVGKLPMYPGIRPAWFIHKAGWAASMQRLLDAAGGNSIADLQAGAGPSFLGYPVVFTQVMNSTLTAQTSTDGLCYFGDLEMACLFGDRRMLTVRSSEHRYFDQDQIAVLGTERIDITVHSTGTASAAGAVIMLSTPGS